MKFTFPQSQVCTQVGEVEERWKLLHVTAVTPNASFNNEMHERMQLCSATAAVRTCTTGPQLLAQHVVRCSTRHVFGAVNKYTASGCSGTPLALPLPRALARPTCRATRKSRRAIQR